MSWDIRETQVTGVTYSAVLTLFGLKTPAHITKTSGHKTNCFKECEAHGCDAALRRGCQHTYLRELVLGAAHGLSGLICMVCLRCVESNGCTRQEMCGHWEFKMMHMLHCHVEK